MKKINSLSLRGYGWWYDRRRRCYIEIHDHAINACNDEKRYRILDVTNACIRAAINLTKEGRQTETTRDLIIPAVCSKGFIRVRWLPKHATLGWQFAADPRGALKVLKRFINRFGVGPSVELTFTDFSTSKEAKCLISQIDGTAITEVIEYWEKTRVR